MTGIDIHCRRLLREESGFTLVELLAALAILLTVMTTLVTLMVSATKAEVDLTQRVQAQQEMRLALERIRHEIHLACTAEHRNLVAGTADATPGAKTNVRLAPPSGSLCPSPPTTFVTWCTELVSPNKWRLRRVEGTPTSCTGGRIEANHLTTPTVFTLEHAVGSLMKLNVNFPVDLHPSDTRRAYRLEDSLVLRNSVRAS